MNDLIYMAVMAKMQLEAKGKGPKDTAAVVQQIIEILEAKRDDAIGAAWAKAIEEAKGNEVDS